MNTISINNNSDYPINLFEEEDHFFGSDNQEPLLLLKQDKAISPWFQQKNNLRQKKQSDIQKPLILDFLSTLRDRQNSFRSKLVKKNKPINSNEKSQTLYQLNNTIITFPKSRQGGRLQNEEDERIFQKSYKKRFGQKIIPKQLKLIQLQGSPQKIQKIYKMSKHLSHLKKSKSPDFKDLKEKKLYQIGQLSPIIKRQKQKNSQKIKRSSSMNEVQQKFYKTLNFQKMISKTRNQLIEKAKVSHLNRNPQIQSLQMHCMGSTISNWNNLRSAYLNKVRK